VHNFAHNVGRVHVNLIDGRASHVNLSLYVETTITVTSFILIQVFLSDPTVIPFNKRI
jgi:hypothetical protein